MKKSESKKNVLSRRAFMKSVTAGGGALVFLGLMGNSLSANDLEVFSDPKRAKVNETAGFCQCGIGQCGGGGGGGRGGCQCGIGQCGGSGG